MKHNFMPINFSASIRLFMLAVVIPFGLSACDKSKSGSLGTKSIVYCSEGSPENFNPQTITSGVTIDATSNQLYDRLITFNSDNTLAPALATAWHVTKDGKKITFYLRKDVSFHHTEYFTPSRTFNADDVLFSFNRILKPAHSFHSISGSKYPFFQNINFTSLVSEVEKINDYTIRFILTRPDSSFLANLATSFSVILSAEYATKLIQSDEHYKMDILPIGTGPFKLKEYHTGSFIRYYPHLEYWQSTPYLRQLIFDITPSKTGRLTKLLAGECDVISYPIAHKKIQNRPDLTLEEVTSLNVGYLGFNTKKPPFDNKLVRQAIAFAINKPAIIETIYKGKAELANSIISKSSWAYQNSTEKQMYSPEKAKALLNEAGYPDGFTMDIWAMPVQRAYNPNALTMAKLIQADLSKIGIKVEIVSYEWSAFLRRLKLGEHQSVLLGWSADNPDPNNFFSTLLSCESVKSGSNRTFWCNDEFDHLISQALLTVDIEQRKKYYHKASVIIANEIPLLPIAHSKRFQARSKAVKGKLLNSFGGISFTNASIN
jgi:cationic peptide transport system substrate-binding protein